jgi:hypothetical protein
MTSSGHKNRTRSPNPRKPEPETEKPESRSPNNIFGWHIRKPELNSGISGFNPRYPKYPNSAATRRLAHFHFIPPRWAGPVPSRQLPTPHRTASPHRHGARTRTAAQAHSRQPPHCPAARRPQPWPRTGARAPVRPCPVRQCAGPPVPLTPLGGQISGLRPSALAPPPPTAQAPGSPSRRHRLPPRRPPPSRPGPRVGASSSHAPSRPGPRAATGHHAAPPRVGTTPPSSSTAGRRPGPGKNPLSLFSSLSRARYGGSRCRTSSPQSSVVPFQFFHIDGRSRT